MRCFAATTMVLAVLSQLVVAQQMTINTLTDPVQCEPSQFTWQGGKPPYYLYLVPAGQPAAPALKQFPTQDGTSFTWVVDMPSGSSFSTVLKDGSGAQAFSDQQTVQASSETSCLNGGSSSTSAPATASGSGTSATTTSSASTSHSVGAVVQKAASTTASSGTAAAAATTTMTGTSTALTSSTAGATSSNAASPYASAGAIGLAGVLGLVGAAVLG